MSSLGDIDVFGEGDIFAQVVLNFTLFFTVSRTTVNAISLSQRGRLLPL